MSIGINFFGSIYTEDGIGEATRLTLKLFEKAGIDVVLNSLSRPVAREQIKESFNEFKTPYNINYFHFSARWVEYYLNIIGKDKLANKYNIGHWLTEMQDYPDEWAKNYKYFDEIWTASTFCQDSISMKIPSSTILMPYPIVGKTVAKNNKIHVIDRAKFNFLIMANMYSDIERKNILQSLEAFQKAFPSNEDVSLIVKISNPEVDEIYMNKILNYVKLDQRIIIIDKFISRDEVNFLFQSVDAYVSLHRAEGFGLTIGEAMFHNIPVITTAYSGNMDFCNTFNCFLVDYDLVRVGEDRLRYRKDNFWAQPRLDSAIENFKKVYTNRNEVNLKTKRAKEFIEENFSIEKISIKVKKRIDLINSNFELTGSFGEFME